MFLKTRCNPYKGFRSSHPEVFCEKDVANSFSKFTGKQLLWGLLLIKLQAKKRLQRTRDYLWVLQNFQERLFTEYLRWLLLSLVKKFAINSFYR